MSVVSTFTGGSVVSTFTGGSVVSTFTGGSVDYLRPAVPGSIKLRDVAEGLSRECRFAGQCPRFYGVAEHCLWVEGHLASLGYSPPTRMRGLLHDAAEAYMRDVPTPLKSLLSGYATVEAALESAIFDELAPLARYGDAVAVKQADRIAYFVERRDLIGDSSLLEPLGAYAKKRVVPVGDPQVAAIMFMDRFEAVSCELHAWGG